MTLEQLTARAVESRMRPVRPVRWDAWQWCVVDHGSTQIARDGFVALFGTREAACSWIDRHKTREDE